MTSDPNLTGRDNEVMSFALAIGIAAINDQPDSHRSHADREDMTCLFHALCPDPIKRTELMRRAKTLLAPPVSIVGGGGSVGTWRGSERSE